MPTPEVSVLMSVRNGLPYVSETIRSIIGQTFADWEFVIVDNASTDGTADLIEEMTAGEERIVFIRSTQDLGHSGGLNLGLAKCRGTWVARIDADDIALPERLERQLTFVHANPDVQVSSCFGYYINEHGSISGQIIHDLTTREVFQRYIDRQLAIGIMHPGALILRELMVQIGGYRRQFDPANDTDLWGRLVDAGALVLVQPEKLMKYRIHGSSISAGAFRRNRLKYQWARDCMRIRRAGGAEPSWEEYLAARAAAPLWKKINRWRKTSARQLYRQSGQDLLSRRIAHAAAEILLAALLQPSYALPRLLMQTLGRSL